MNKIEVKHTCIIINDYTLGDSKKLEANFSIYDMITHSYYFLGIHYVEETKQLFLPRGIDIFYLETIFKAKAFIQTKPDPFDKLDKINIKFLPRDEDQKEALGFMSGSLVKYRGNKDKSQLCLNLNTGKGKSYCSIINSALYCLRSAVITSSINWLNQWKAYILEYTDIKPREIFIISGTPSIQRLLTKDISQYKFILISHSTIKSYGDTYGWDKVSELFQYMKLGIKYYDECHLNFTNMCMIDFYTNTYKTYYVTATPARSDKDENLIYKLYFKNTPSISLFNEELDPHTHYFAIRYNSRPTPMEISDCKNQYGLDRNKYVSSYITKKENYYRVLRIVFDIVLRYHGKCLIYIGNNKAIKDTYDWILEEYPELVGNVGIYTSIISDDVKKQEIEKKVILSTTKSTGTAMDIKDLQFTVVLAEPFKSEVLAVQTLGRTRGDNTTYIDIVDTGFSPILKYYHHKKPIFEKYALTCKEITLKENELVGRSDEIIKRRLNNLKNPFIKLNPSMLRSPFKKAKLKDPFIRRL